MRAHPTSLALVAAVAAVSASSLAGAARANGVAPLDAAAIRAKIDAAAGPAQTHERIVANVVRGGYAETIETLRDGDDTRQTIGYGPFAYRSGVWHGQAWHQNTNGETVLDAPDPGNATADRFTTTVARVAKPFDAYVLSRLNGAGDGTREYVDPQTWHVMRSDRISPTGTAITTFDDFRTVDGVTRAWHEKTDDGVALDARDERIIVYSNAPIAAAAIQTAPGHAFVTFPAGTTSVKLPVKERNGKFIVRVDVGGRGLDFVLDTGSSGIEMDEDVARSLKLPDYARFSSAANAGRYVGRATIVPHMRVGTLEMRDVAISTTPHLGEGNEGEFKTVGLLGFDFIADVALALDYEHGTVTATDPDAFVAPSDPQTIGLPIRIGGQAPLVDVSVNGALGERFTVDTGSSGGLMIFDHFARLHPDAMRDVGAGPRMAGVRFEGVGGEIATRPYQLAAVQVGSVIFKNFIAYRVTDRKAYYGSDDGLIGPEFLGDFTLYTDYIHSMLYLVPNGIGRRVMRPNK